MRVKEIGIDKLFGIFNHRIPLNQQDRITIIHGPNGFGKTVLLRMLDGLFNANYSVFEQVPFEEFRLLFDDLQNVRVRQKAVQRRGSSGAGKEVLFYGPGSKKGLTLNPPSAEAMSFPLSIIERVLPDFVRTGQREWLNRRTGQVLSLDDILDEYQQILPVGLRRDVPPALEELRSSVHVRFIRTDRLVARATAQRTRYPPTETPQIMPAVIAYAKDLSAAIQQTLARSVEFSSSLDRSFPMRLVRQISERPEPSLSEDELRHELSALESKRSRLVAAGLLDKEEPSVSLPGRIDPSALDVLSIYVKDVQDKLEVFDTILEKIELLQRIDNRRFSYKTFSVNKQQGFIFRTPDGSDLPPDALSSGEQHEIVLFYELLFKMPENALILIDEPEISLHIAWQQEFLSDLLEATRLSNFDVLIATHSPDIVHDRWDLTVELVGPEQKQ